MLYTRRDASYSLRGLTHQFTHHLTCHQILLSRDQGSILNLVIQQHSSENQSAIMAPRKRAQQDDEDLEIDEVPTAIDPYSILAVDKEATQDQIKSAYRKAALKHHPDKAAAEDKEAANTKFQEIAFAYAILSDERRRKRYDLTGRTEESLDLEDDDFDWISYYREQYKDVVTLEKIDEFADQYKGSEEERKDVIKYYERFQGSMDKLYQNVMLSDAAEDEDRFRQIIDSAIESEEVEAYKKYTEESEVKRKRRIENARKRKEQEAKEAEKHAEDLGMNGKSKGKGKKKGDGDLGDLAALIQNRQQGRAGNFLADLEAKYAPKGKSTKGGAKRTVVDEPPEEAFAATEARRSKRSKKA